MREKHLTVLLADDAVDTAPTLSTLSTEAQHEQLCVTHVRQLSTAIQYLDTAHFDVVLLALDLPDSRGLEAVRSLRNRIHSVPVVVLTNTEDIAVAIQAVKEGAQDYIVKAHMQSPLLPQVLHCIVELHTVLQELYVVSPGDTLTGLCNRQSFLTLASQHLRYAKRYRQPFLLFVLRLENLVHINTTMGREVGDQVLCEVADVLQSTFRQSDIVARLDGRTFVIMALSSERRHAELYVKRLYTQIYAHDIIRTLPAPLHLHLDHTAYNPACPVTLYELLGKAKIIPPL